MNWEQIKHKFPACMHNFNMPDISKFKLEEIVVYRACVNNKINKEAFLPSCLDPLQVNVIKQRDPNLENPASHSVSVFTSEKEAIRIMKILSSTKSRPFILGKGTTNKNQGIWERSCEWNSKHQKNTHYDYWLYKDNDVYKDFNEIIIE